MLLNYIYLIVAVVFEVIATTALKQTVGFTRLMPSLVAISGYALAFYFLSLPLRTMPVGIVYALWCGAGIILITAIGWVWFGRRSTCRRSPAWASSWPACWSSISGRRRWFTDLRRRFGLLGALRAGTARARRDIRAICVDLPAFALRDSRRPRGAGRDGRCSAPTASSPAGSRAPACARPARRPRRPSARARSRSRSPDGSRPRNAGRGAPRCSPSCGR